MNIITRHQSDILSGLHFRKAGFNDCNNVKMLDENSFVYSSLPSFYFVQAVDVFGDGFIVCDENGQLAGYIICAMSSKEAGVGWILSMAVLPSKRGIGIGQELLERAVSFCDFLRCNLVRLTVAETNSVAQNLYQKNNFVFSGRHHGDFGDGIARLIYERNLS